MAGIFVALISGILMSIQGVFNTQVTKATHIWVANAYVQLTALLAAGLMWIITGRKSFAGVLKVPNKYVLLGGVIGAFITYTVIKSISELGTAKANILIVVTQLVAAYVIELFGLFGSEKSEFSLRKLIGIIIAVIGIVIFNMNGIKRKI